MELSQNRRRLIGRLRRRRQREREGAVLVEGVRAVTEALDAEVNPVFGVVSSALASSEAHAGLTARLGAACDVAVVDAPELDALADTGHPQGVLLVCRQPEHGPERVPGEGRLLVLDAVQDPGNVGTLIRSAVAFSLDGVLVLDGTTDPWGAKAVRASAGTVFRIGIWSATVLEAARLLEERGAETLVASASGRPAVEAFARPTPLRALVLGNEGAGVRAELCDVAHGAVAVPMSGAAESLNVGVAGSILMYEWTR